MRLLFGIFKKSVKRHTLNELNHLKDMVLFYSLPNLLFSYY